MIRLLPFILIPLLIVGGFGAWRIFFVKSQTASPSTLEQTIQKSEPVEVPKFAPTDTDEQKSKTLQSAVDKLVTEINSLKSANAALEAKVNTLTTNQSTLNTTVTALSASSSPGQSTSTSGNPSVYIPIGSGSSNTYNNQAWYTLTDYQVSLNPVWFPGYTNMVLEAVFRLNTPSGTASVQLINTATGASLATLSTNSVSSAVYTSGTFTIPAGTNTYAIQVQSTNGTPMFIELARIRVNF